MKYKRYPKVKDSGVEWIGEIPEEWEKNKIKRLTKNTDKSFVDGDWIESPFITDYGIRLIQTGNIGIGRFIEKGDRYIAEETFSDLNCTEVFPNDILICRLAGPVGRACLAPVLKNRMITSIDITILKNSEKHNPKFIVYLLSNSNYLKWIDTISRGSTRARISRSMLGDFKFYFPPRKLEEDEIVDFLDKQTTQFDVLILKSKAQITLLEEKRQAMINQAVTKGLDPSVKMKDSGVEWIGDIPEGWEVKKLKYSVDLYSKKSNGNANERPYVGLEHIESQTGRLIPDFPITFEGDSKEFDSGDVLFGKLRPYLAKAILADFAGTCSGELLVLRGNEIKPDLLHRLVLSDGFIQLVNSATYGVKMPRAEWSMIGNIFIPIPKEEKEQIQIIAFLKKQTTQFDELIAKSKTQITLLEEKKQALITAAVTGKIDVRGTVE